MPHCAHNNPKSPLDSPHISPAMTPDKWFNMTGARSSKHPPGTLKPENDADGITESEPARSQASKRLRTIDALVHVMPNEFDSTQPTATLSRRLRTIGISANSGSRFSILALSQMKPLFIISRE